MLFTCAGEFAVWFELTGTIILQETSSSESAIVQAEAQHSMHKLIPVTIYDPSKACRRSARFLKNAADPRHISLQTGKFSPLTTHIGLVPKNVGRHQALSFSWSE